ncbi:hypothetical protein F5883DRAFT_675073, partial [Diaporthe sp. PMI_573]
CDNGLWTFSRLVNTIPTLETDNVVFFFAKVAINGWFRYLALVYCVINAATLMRFAYRVTRVTAIAWHCYKSGRKVLEKEELNKIKDIISWDDVRTEIRCLNWLTWVLVIVAVELTVQWNHLSPTANLQAPGQLIPFVTRIIIFINSSFTAGPQVLPSY